MIKKTLAIFFSVFLVCSLVACNAKNMDASCPKCGNEVVDGAYFCSNCGLDLSAEEPILNSQNTFAPNDTHTHNFDEWETVNSPTCTLNGTEKRKCVTCDYTENRSIEKIICEEINGQCSMCHKMMNPINFLKNYVITNGSLLSSNVEYLYTDNTYTDSNGYTNYIEYNSKSDEFTIGILIQLSDGMSVYTTNVIDINNSTQKIQMQYSEGGRYHYCSANITTNFCDENNEMSSFVYRGDAPSLQSDMYGLLNQSILILLKTTNQTLYNINPNLSLSQFGYIYYN